MTDRLAQFAELSPAKQRLLLERLRQQKPAPPSGTGGGGGGGETSEAAADGSAERRTIPRRSPENDPPPLSWAQERLWLIDRLQPGTVAYHVSLVVRLRGELDVAAFSRALGDVVARHEALRTWIGQDGDRPVQRIAPPRPGRHHPILVAEMAEMAKMPDLSGPAASDGPARRAVRRILGRPFDLAGGAGAASAASPLVRSVLLRLGPDEHLAVLDIHHIVTDGWSNGLVIRELAALYAAHRSGRASPLAPPPLQYGDFAVWQRRELTDEHLAELLEAEAERLDGAPQVLDLPTDRPRRGAGDRGAVVRHAVEPEVVARVERTARAAGATLFMAVAAAFGAVLARWAGQGEVLLGTAVAGRRWSELEETVGFFVNALVLRIDIGGEPTWRQVLERVRGDSLEAFGRQDLPFARLVEHLAPRRSLDRNPLYQAQVVLQNTPEVSAEVSGLAFEGLEIEPQRAQMDLSLDLRKGSRGELVIGLGYRSELYDATTVQRLVRRFADLLDRSSRGPMASMPSMAPMSELLAPAGAERHQVLQEWSRSIRAPVAPTLRDAVAAAVRRWPEAVAVESLEGRLSYAELHRAALGLAGRLVERGVGFGVPVAVWMDAGLARVVAQLALYQIGAVYLPLDPTFPPERVRFSLADAGVALGIVSPGFTLPGEGVESLSLGGLDDLRVLAASPPPPGDPVPLDDTDRAYVIYTSGSTGRPKGVVIPHRAIAVWIDGFASRHGLGPGSRVPHLSGPAFDASMIDLWLPLTRGGTVVIPDDDTRRSPDLLLAWFGEQGITQGWPVTPLAEALLAAMEAGGPGVVPWALHALQVGGDRMRTRPAPELPFTVFNNYGPTETTVIAIQSPVAPAGADPALQRLQGLPEIGRPLVGVTARLLDRRLEPAAPGEAGQIVLGGSGLAAGYLDRPAVTAEVFVPDPYPDPSDPSDRGAMGARVYLTGDLGRFRSDGRIDYLGRLDRQVQVRGFRIEPGEVEAALVSHPAVAEAAVVAHGEASGETVLAAYVVPAPGAGADDVTPAILAPHLERRLPPALVPAFWTVLPAIPRTSTDKLDRLALPAPTAGGAGASGSRAAPETAMEIYLAGVWAELLSVGSPGSVGRHDDFFHLGGHSLLATRLTTRVRRELGLELPLRAVFEAPTLERLAAVLDAETVGETDGGPTALPRSAWPAAFPLSPAQERLWFLDRFDPGSSVYNIPTTVRLGGALEPAALSRALNLLAVRHESLRTTFDGVVTDSPRQWIAAAGAPIPSPLVDLSALAAARREAAAGEWAAIEGHRPFDLVQGPVVRSLLVRLAPREHVLVLTLHHAVSDGWSQNVLLGELTTAYDAFVAGPVPEAPELPELPLQYPDFAVWQRRWLSGERLDAQMTHWRRQLAGAPDLLPLPLDRPRSGSQTSAGSAREIEIPAELAAGLVRLAKATGTTLFMVLMAAFQALLGRLSDQSVVVVGTPIANRHRPELEGIVGFFVNTLAIPGRLGDDPPFEEHLGRVRETVLEAFAHQDLPFARLVEELEPERSLAHHPIFQVALSVESEPAAERRHTTLEVSALAGDADRQPAKFDLQLSFVDTEGALRGSLGYRTELFDAATAAELVDCILALLESAVSEPSRRVSRLALPPSADRLREASLRAATEAADAAEAADGATPALSKGLPRTPMERAVAEIWKDLLGVDQVRLEDNFFHRGGHSLLATQVVARLAEELGLQVPIRVLFEQPTLAALADHLVGEELTAELAHGELGDDQLERMLDELDGAVSRDEGDEP